MSDGAVIGVSDVWAVVVNWNGGELNLACISGLLAAGLAQERVVFVDNASEDGSREAVQERFGGLPTIRNERNLGFGEAANMGARAALAAGARAVVFVNNDLVFSPDALELLCAELSQDSRTGIVGPRVLDRDDPRLVWCAGGELSWRQNLSTLVGHGRQDGPEYQRTHDVDYVPGCALLARRELLESVGLFDAAYFAYMEDVDLCLRASGAGWRVLLVGAASALHAWSSATGGGYNPRRKYMMGVNMVWFLRSHGGAREWLRFSCFDVCSLPVLWLLGLFTGRAKAVLAKGAGILAGLRGKRVTTETLERGSWLW